MRYRANHTFIFLLEVFQEFQQLFEYKAVSNSLFTSLPIKGIELKIFLSLDEKIPFTFNFWVPDPKADPGYEVDSIPVIQTQVVPPTTCYCPPFQQFVDK